MTFAFHLKDDRRIGGLYGDNSYASHSPAPPEIYLEETWHVDEKGFTGARVKSTAGVLIQGSDIQAIEFFRTIRSEHRDGGKKQESSDCQRQLSGPAREPELSAGDASGNESRSDASGWGLRASSGPQQYAFCSGDALKQQRSFVQWWISHRLSYRSASFLTINGTFLR